MPGFVFETLLLSNNLFKLTLARNLKTVSICSSPFVWIGACGPFAIFSESIFFKISLKCDNLFLGQAFYTPKKAVTNFYYNSQIIRINI